MFAARVHINVLTPSPGRGWTPQATSAAKPGRVKKKRVTAVSSDEDYEAGEESEDDAVEDDAPADESEPEAAQPKPRTTPAATPGARLGIFAARTPGSVGQTKRPAATPVTAAQAKKLKPQGYAVLGMRSLCQAPLPSSDLRCREKKDARYAFLIDVKDKDGRRPGGMLHGLLMSDVYTARLW